MSEHKYEPTWKVYETESVIITRTIRLDTPQEVMVKGPAGSTRGQRMNTDCVRITLTVSSTIDDYGDSATKIHVWDDQCGWRSLSTEDEKKRVKSLIPQKYFAEIAVTEDIAHPSEKEN